MKTQKYSIYNHIKLKKEANSYIWTETSDFFLHKLLLKTNFCWSSAIKSWNNQQWAAGQRWIAETCSRVTGKCELRDIFQCWLTLIWWMRARPSSLIVFCLLRSVLSLGFGWGLVTGCDWSLVLDGVCWRDRGRETPVGESLPDRLHISHTRAGLVFT